MADYTYMYRYINNQLQAPIEEIKRQQLVNPYWQPQDARLKTENSAKATSSSETLHSNLMKNYRSKIKTGKAANSSSLLQEVQIKGPDFSCQLIDAYNFPYRQACSQVATVDSR